jgi:hypothetical protein
LIDEAVYNSNNLGVEIMNKLSTLVAAAGLALATGSASAWWGPWNHGYNNYDGWGDGVGDVFGDTDFSMNFSGRGSGRGYGRGYGYDRYYGGYAPYYGHGPYGYGAAPYYGAPVSETAAKDLANVPEDVLAAQRKAATEHFKQLEEQRQAAMKQAQEQREAAVKQAEEQRQAMQKSYEEMMKSRQAQWENRYASPAPAPFVAR